MARRRLQLYATDAIEVTFDPGRCIHYGYCVRTLPEVFEAAARPWVRPGAASVERVVEAVLGCPTGALHYRLKGEAAAQETGAEAARVRVLRNGPLVLSGDVRVVLDDGTEVVRDTRVALCRCGRSGNMPFCDNTHRASGWRQALDAAPVGEAELAPLDDGPRLP